MYSPLLSELQAGIGEMPIRRIGSLLKLAVGAVAKAFFYVARCSEPESAPVGSKTRVSG